MIEDPTGQNTEVVALLKQKSHPQAFTISPRRPPSRSLQLSRRTARALSWVPLMPGLGVGWACHPNPARLGVRLSSCSKPARRPPTSSPTCWLSQ
jgi:hypothetical protein